MTPPCAYALAPAALLSWTSAAIFIGTATLLLVAAPVLALADTAAPEAPPPPLAPADPGAAAPDTTPRFYIREFRVDGGGKLLTPDEVEEAVYPFMGPYRTAADVEQARSALEQAYHNKGYQTVTVSIPAQHTRGGIIHLAVSQGEIGRLRVVGSRFFDIEEIKSEAPSLQEGTSPNFTQVSHDLVVLNQLSDRRVTPTVRPGEVPGTVDVDLTVKDTFPLHGSLEINNRYSANTPELRLNGALNYDNLWQLGHEIGVSFQLSPQNVSFNDNSMAVQGTGGNVSLADTSSVEVFSGYYLARVPDLPWLNLILQGTWQDSDVNTLAGIGVAGKGQTIGLRAVITLPQLTSYYHSLSLGFDYKHYSNIETLNTSGESLIGAPITYYPLSAAYSGSWIGKGYETDLNASLNLDFRGWGSDSNVFGINRYGADGSFIYFRGDVSHTRDIPGNFQLFGKIQGQAADKPLIDNEQFSAGGLGTVRGYLESEDLGDNGIIGNFELRTPSLGDFMGKAVDDWRFYAFGDAGLLTIDDALPEQQESFKLASVGGGTRVKLQDHYNGSLDVGLPLVNSVDTHSYEPRLTFRVWAEF
jgi:hemolysin activation/secretion protein